MVILGCFGEFGCVFLTQRCGGLPPPLSGGRKIPIFLRLGSLSLLVPFGFFFGKLAGGKGGGVGHVDAEE